MKALILAAGFGTRLLPHTRTIPKPLFPIAGRPLIDILIGQLMTAGTSAIAVNTHHLGDQIDQFIGAQTYPVPVVTRFEPEILGTGGAVRNFSDFLSGGPFLVINSDVLTDLDFGKIYDYHNSHPHPVTLVLHDHPEFNTVSVDPDGFITGFSASGEPGPLLAFTGIQVVDPVIQNWIPGSGFVNSIDVYRRMIEAGEKIKAMTVQGHYWNDLGKPERYRDAVVDHTAPAAFETAFGRAFSGPFGKHLLAGDGSDRKWFRITSGGHTLILGDHGIQTDPRTGEFDAYTAIGAHLHRKGIPVPRIMFSDRFSGLVFLEDLGDTPLQEVIAAETAPDRIVAHYRPIIDDVIRLSIAGAEGFDPAWTYQSPSYDRQLIIEKEGRYFTGAFLKGYLGFDSFSDAALEPEFEYLADRILAHAVTGLMHRDMQSRNIMVRENRHYFIDFQGARSGPLQYDLASLLIDPYVALDDAIRDLLLQHAIASVGRRIPIDPDRFATGYRYCAVSRTMQALGAYGHLTRIKNKVQFERYIPVAIHTLNRLLARLDDSRLSGLRSVAASAADMIADIRVSDKRILENASSVY